MLKDLFRELYDYRAMVSNLVKRDLRGRYKGSVLGFVWNLILPMMQIVVYVMVFTIIFRSNLEHYYAYLIVGMIPWIMFSDSLSSGAGSVVDNSQLITKIRFPRSVIPVSIVLSKLVNFAISMVIVFIVLVAEHGIDPVCLSVLPVSLICLVMFSLGMAMLLSALNVYVRDVQYLITVILMMWIWMTPIMYAANSFDNELFQLILSINPATYLVELFQDPLYWHVFPTWSDTLIAVGESVVVFLLGCVVFDRLSKNFAEVL